MPGEAVEPGMSASRGDLLDVVLEALPASILVLDRGGRIVMANRHFLGHVGRTLREVSGLSAWDHLPRALVEAARLSEKLDALFRTGAFLPGERVSFRGPALSTRIFWYRLVRASPAGSGDRALLILDDVTAQERASQDVRQALRAQRLAALGGFVAGVAHELRNPLAIASSAAQLLEDGGLSPEEEAACLRRVRIGILRADSIIQALAGLTPRSAPQQRERLSVAALLVASCSWVEEMAVDQGIRLIRSVPQEPLAVEGIRDSLEQAVFALLLNAVQAMPRGGDLRATVREEGAEAVIRVEDSGHGIAPDVVERVFDPFFTTRPPGENQGLGLSLAYAAVTGHGGTLTVESGPGRGTVATVRLPLAPDDGGAAPGSGESVP